MSKLTDLLKASRLSLAHKAKEALDWLRNSIRNILTGKTDDPRNPTDDLKKKSISDMEIGKLYLFEYDPYYKDELPYWDKFPLVFPIGPKPQRLNPGHGPGFLGINLHYLPPRARAVLMDALLETASNDKYDDTTKLNISYEILKGASETFVRFDECVKVYLYGHIRGGVYYVPPSKWSQIIMLPLQQWVRNVNSKRRGTPPY